MIETAERVKQNDIPAEDICQLVVKGMQEKKGVNIIVLNLKGVKNAIADYFVICSGKSDTQVDALADSIDEEVHKASGVNPWHREGKNQKEWILLDYVDVVAHVFKQDRRDFYRLEELWGDAEMTVIEDEA